MSNEEGQAEAANQAESVEIRELLEANLKLARDNNDILRRMQFWGRVTFWTKTILWTAVLVLPVLLYSYFAPVINSTMTNLFGIPTPSQFNKIFHPGK